MHIFKLVSIVLLTLTGAISCDLGFSSSTTDTSLSDTASSTSGDTTSGVTTSEQTAIPDVVSSQEYFDFFSPTSKVTINVTMTRANLFLVEEYGLSGNELTDIYLPAAIAISVNNGSTIKNYNYAQVGIRLKGNLSRNTFITDEGVIEDYANFKISFDEFVADQRFLGMAKLDLKWNRNRDHTYIRQVYAYKMFQDYIDMSAGATLGNFGITQTGGFGSTHTHMGVYNIVEVIDKRLIKRHYPKADAEGNLYKVTYNNMGPADFTMNQAVSKNGSAYTRIPDGKIGIEDMSRNYRPSYDLKTNKTTPNYQDMANLIGYINSTTNYSSSVFKTLLDSSIDINNFLMLEAVAYFMGNPDDMRNNYNNTYVYFEPSSGKAIFMPYDFDRAFGCNGNWDPTGDSMTTVAPFSSNAYGFWGDQYNMNPLYRTTVMNGGNGTYKSQFRDNIVSIMAGDWLTTTHFNAMYNSYRTNYASDVNPDIDQPYLSFSLTEVMESNMTFSSYISAKIATTNGAL